MTPHQFVEKWQKAGSEEHKHAHEHFIDLCRLLNHPTPAEADAPEDFCFERGVKKTGGGDGWADVWKRGCFAWEYKTQGKDLGAALVQLQRYGPALDNPPLLVVSDITRIEIHTSWTNTVHKVYNIDLVDLPERDNLQLLRWLFDAPERLRPDVTTIDVTDAAAKRFAQIAQRLRDRNFDPQRVAHFLSRIVFCLFAEDVGLLPARVFARLLDALRKNPVESEQRFRVFFSVMHTGGSFGVEEIQWFNGGLFNDDDALPLEPADIGDIIDVAKLDWSAIEPSIFGTLFERGLDPSKRSQLGAHYTDPQTIMRLVGPVVEAPLLAEWAACKVAIEESLAKEKGAQPLARGKKRAFDPVRKTSKARQQAQDAYKAFLDRLGNFRVLDPACGSGNFLYLALQTLKDIEHRSMLEAEQMGLHREFAEFNVGVQCVQGIELNSYAAELARMTIWIGDISWSLKHGVQLSKQPILKPLERIECRDAVVNEDGTEAIWPKVDVIVGNPPFLGDKKMIGVLGEEYVRTLRARYKGRVAGGADLVCYWFEKARSAIVDNGSSAAGLVGTNSIRGGANRGVLDRIGMDSHIFEAWSDEPWINEGAAVRVSLVCFGDRAISRLNGDIVSNINTDLTGGGLDLTRARALQENRNCCFYATVKAGNFDVDGATARKWLRLPNPNGRANSDVLKPWVNALDVVRRPNDKWAVDFGVAMSCDEAAMYEAPFQHVVTHVKPARDKTRRMKYREMWWLFAEPIPGMRAALSGLTRYIATPAVAKHRVFVWVPTSVVADHALMVIARDDSATFGILHSRFHRIWSLRLGTSLENRPRYTPTTSFETFPFPEGFTPDIAAEKRADSPWAQKVASTADVLDTLRERWLNPLEWIDRVPEVAAGYPDRLIPKPEHSKEIEARTLTNLYNAMPTWLSNSHRDLDSAVAKAYGWGDYAPQMTDEEILRRLLALNLARAPAG